MLEILVSRLAPTSAVGSTDFSCRIRIPTHFWKLLKIYFKNSQVIKEKP